MPNPDQLLEAGALLPTKAKIKDAAAVDDISGRVYQHPALGERCVVRLSSDNLAEGDDLTMEFLGFEKPAVEGPVAKRRRQALGFPEWALVNDPKHARYALELVKEFKKESRRARSKPGHAYDAFTEISKRLGKSVAHFLPSFWEQIGREFIAVGNSTYASRAFGKAREAERVHNLKVDEAIRQDAFLEFALAGCVSAKALTEYGKELQAAHEPGEAWEFLRDLSVRRTLGGLPPWTSMCKDLQPLIKSAGLDPEEELQKILVEIVDSPAIFRSPMGFWKGASKTIAKLVKKNDTVAGVLLNLIPKTSSWRNDDIWPWLDFLDSWGILENAWKEDVAAAAAPQGGPAEWFTRLAKNDSSPRQKLYDILESMADRLKKDGIPLDLNKSHRWGRHASSDVDLLDLALSLDVTVVDPLPELTLNLTEWARVNDDDDKIRDRPRDPVALAADSRYRKTLQNAVKVVAGEAVFEAAAQGKKAMQDTRREWLLNLTSEIASGGLPPVEASLQVVHGRTSADTYREFPEAFDKLKSIDLLPAVTRTIQAGIFDEYGWPKLEEVVERFTGKYTTGLSKAKDKSKPLIYGAFPYAIVSDGLQAVVVRGDEIVHEAEINVPAGLKLARLSYVDGSLLVEVSKGYQRRIFWNNKPKEFEERWSYGEDGLSGTVVDIPAGGTFVGDRIIHAGDKHGLTAVPGDNVFHDGEHFWHWGHSPDHEDLVIRETDPLTGKEGRKSMPSFFEDYIAADAKLEMNRLQLVKLGDVVRNSPLGSKDGTVGFRVRRFKSGASECEGIDGRSIRSESDDVVFTALLNQPATDNYLAIASDGHSYRTSNALNVWDPTGRFQIAELRGGVGAYNRGQVAGYTSMYLHALQLRDEATSKKLRAITEKQVSTLANAAADDMQAFQGKLVPSEGVDFPALDKAIRKLLPKLKSDRLHVGLRAIMIRYVQKVRQLEKLIADRDPEKVVQQIAVSGADASIESTSRCFQQRINVPPNIGVFSAVAQAAQFFTGETDQLSAPTAACDVMRFGMQTLPRKAWCLYWTQEENADADWLTFMEALAETGVLDLPGTFQLYSTSFADDVPPFPIPEAEETETAIDLRMTAVSWVQKASRFLITRSWQHFQILEYSPTGKFEALKGSRISEESTVIRPAWSSEQLTQFVKLARKKEQELPAVEDLKQAAEDMGVSLAEVALIWFGYPNMHRYSAANFMPKNLREAMKLKTKEVSAAKESLNALPEELRDGLVTELLNGPAEEFWQRPPNKMLARLKALWAKQKPNRLELPAEMVEKITGAFGYHQDSTKLLVALNEPESSSMFSPKTKWQLSTKDDELDLNHNSTDDPFDVQVLNAAALCIPWLSYYLPVGDGARERMVAVHAATEKALNNPDLLMDAGHGYFYNAGDSSAAQAAAEAVLGKMKKVKGIPLADNGTLIVGHVSWRLHRAFRPAKLKKAKDYEKLQQQLDATTQQEYRNRSATVAAIQLIRSSDFSDLCKRIKKSPVPSGQFEANPLLACPQLVEDVSTKLSVSENAAVYYLQLLGLADPTDKNIKLWNGWTAGAIKKAAAELIAAKQILEAKRARAGRKYFLPGGWEALKSPHLPIETWKMSLFGMNRDAAGRAQPPLSRILPLEPVHQLFEKAWQRVVDGDEPKYEEVA